MEGGGVEEGGGVVEGGGVEEGGGNANKYYIETSCIKNINSIVITIRAHPCQSSIPATSVDGF